MIEVWGCFKFSTGKQMQRNCSNDELSKYIFKCEVSVQEWKDSRRRYDIELNLLCGIIALILTDWHYFDDNQERKWDSRLYTFALQFITQNKIFLYQNRGASLSCFSCIYPCTFDTRMTWVLINVIQI